MTFPSELLDLVASIVAEDEEFYVPVKKLWVYLCRDGDYPHLSLDEFVKLLQQDPRFEFVQGPGPIEILEDLTAEEKEELEIQMEEFGFYSGPRVGLKSRKPTKEDILHIMEKKVEDIFVALKQAWELRPPHDPQREDQLLDALAKTQRLQREIQKVLNSVRKERTANEQR